VNILYHPNSTYARRVRLVDHEKNLGLDFQLVDMANREHRGEAFKALNPYGRVPVLRDGDLVLYESTAILSYLEARFPEPSLTPDTIEDKARMEMLIKLCDIQFTCHVGPIIFPKRFMPESRWDKAAMAEAKAKIEKHLAILEPQLENKTYLVADRFTLADLCYLPFLHFLPLMEIEPTPNIAAWNTRLQARESAKATVPSA